MKIVKDFGSKATVLSLLHWGDCFIYPRDEEQIVYMKIGRGGFYSNDPNVVNLATGQAELWGDRVPVVKVSVAATVTNYQAEDE